ncbi:MAG: ATP-binding protein [Gammaproteobacteria bacterium]|nr:MAG: ATP-binding protein [Gammaproteobacteria bacterium]
MSLATVLTRAQFGLDAPAVRVEVYCGTGLPQFAIVGLAEAAVRESRDRVRAAIQHCGFTFPAGRITVSLAPAELPKEGGRFDLAIALGILSAAPDKPWPLPAATEFYGELSLSGELRPVRGMLATAVQAALDGHRLVVPMANVAEARLARGAIAAGVESLTSVWAALRGGLPFAFDAGGDIGAGVADAAGPDLAEVRGQAAAKRALEIAAAGGHSLLLIGPPGSGKSMLAQRFAGLLPPPDDAEALESAMLHSLGRDPLPLAHWRRRPFRAPHHGASAAAVIGGGGRLTPGEISLAHHGVLFLDELPEFRRDVLEGLREPLETGVVHIARAAWRGHFPARFQLIAAMNPCPCGHAGDPAGRCRCPPQLISRYLGKISGPLLDRIDLQVAVPRLEYRTLRLTPPAGEGSAAVAARVAAARARQQQRGALNSSLEIATLEAACGIGAREHGLLDTAARRFGLSARACHRILRVARTIADLAGTERVDLAQLSEAVSYRRLERLVVDAPAPCRDGAVGTEVIGGQAHG